MNKKSGLIIGKKFVFGAAVTSFLTIVLFPFIWQLITSLKPPAQLYKMPPDWWPEEFFFENYINTFINYPFANYILNSVLVPESPLLFVWWLLRLLPMLLPDWTLKEKASF